MKDIRTTDIYLATYLKCRGKSITDIEWMDNGKAAFIIESAPEELREYSEGTPMVNIHKFRRMYLDLKERLFFSKPTNIGDRNDRQ